MKPMINRRGIKNARCVNQVSTAAATVMIKITPDLAVLRCPPDMIQKPIQSISAGQRRVISQTGAQPP
jgi:hypothetical protein